MAELDRAKRLGRATTCTGENGEKRRSAEGKKKALYNASKVRSFHAAAGADTSIV